jgi:hypothetical protein
VRWVQASRRLVPGIAGATAIAAALIATGAASAGTYGQPDKVLVATTGNSSELMPTLDIRTAAGISPRVVMSLPPRRLGGLELGDRLRTSAELEVTTDCLAQEARCVGHPYTYNPTVSAQLVLAPDGTTTGGPTATPISRVKRHQCEQQLPNREHHCVLVFMWPFLDLSASLPCMPAACHVNLVADAYSPQAQPGDELIVGEDEPDGTTRQDKGRVNSIRLRPNAPGPEPAERVSTQVGKTPVVSQLEIGSDADRNHTVVFSQELPDLQAGDQLAAWATLRTDISRLPYNVLVQSKLILTSRPDATKVTRLAKQVVGLEGELTEANGFNCTHASTPCRTLKAGVGKLIATPRDRSGARVPLYANLVVGTMAKRASASPGDAADVLGGSLRVTRYPDSRRG